MNKDYHQYCSDFGYSFTHDSDFILNQRESGIEIKVIETITKMQNNIKELEQKIGELESTLYYELSFKEDKY